LPVFIFRQLAKTTQFLQLLNKNKNKESRMIYKYVCIEELITKFIEECGDDYFIQKRTRERQPTITDVWATSWGCMLRHKDIADPYSFHGKKFRRRFRIPYLLFRDWLVPLCEESNVFCTSQSRIPVEFKVLVALRILGRNNSADDTNELSGGVIGESTCNTIFKVFVTKISNLLYHEYVKEPEGQELQRVMEGYRLLGLPGAIGSMDVTHVWWARCPPELVWSCTGKEEHPTLAFQCVVDHNRRIHHVSVPFFGGTNDKTITKNDSFPLRVACGKYRNVEYVLYDDTGIPQLCKGVYLIVDGGYDKEGHLMCPKAWPVQMKDVKWSEWLESCRKDVECTFGIIKARWRWLRSPILFKSMDLIGDAMRTACIFHNVLLTWDHLETDYTRTEAYWNNLEPDLMDRYALIEPENQDVVGSFNQPAVRETALNFFTLNRYKHLLRGGKTYGRYQHHALQTDLITHFQHQYRMGDLWWPKGLKEVQRIRMPITDEVFHRSERESEKYLYVGTSHHRNDTATPIGNGLFSSIGFKCGDHICYFIGEERSAAEFKDREERGLGGYAHHFTNSLVYDCYNFKTVCKASMANTCRGLFHIVSGSAATNNAEIHVDVVRRRVRLVATMDIPANTEIMTPYGGAFRIR
jgi:hypothetical protein